MEKRFSFFTYIISHIAIAGTFQSQFCEYRLMAGKMARLTVHCTWTKKTHNTKASGIDVRSHIISGAAPLFFRGLRRRFVRTGSLPCDNHRSFTSFQIRSAKRLTPSPADEAVPSVCKVDVYMKM